MGTPTEEPTPRRLRHALEQGDAPVSAFATQAIAFAAALAVVPAGGLALSNRASSELRAAIAQAASPSPTIAFSPSVVGSAVVGFVAPVVGVAAIAAMIGAIVQSGGKFAPKKLAPRLDRLDLSAGFARVLSTARVLAVARAIVYVGAVAYVARATIRAHVADLVHTAGRLDGTFVVTATLARDVMVRAALVGLLLAAIDVVVTRAAWRKRHRMTKADVERERKESEGDPRLRADRRRAHQDMLAAADVANVAGASVVVADPRFACALRYDEASGAAPIVVASAIGVSADRIADAARERGVPVVHDAAIARALVGLEVGRTIPESLYEPIAEILREAWGATGERPVPDA